MKSILVPIFAWFLFAAIALVGSGCGIKEADCPKGATLAGAAPLDGYEQWCEKKNKAGKVVFHGPYASWYQNGNSAIHATYKNGYLHGPYTNSYKSGRVAKRGNYVKGIEDGVWIFRYENGRLKMKGAYKNGMPDGEWRLYDPEDFQTTLLYENGRKVN